MTTQSFPEFFRNQNSYMFLSENKDNTYSLLPPNQLDWMYTLAKISDTEWHVSGVKEEFEHCSYTYHLVNDKWIHHILPDNTSSQNNSQDNRI